MRRLISRTFFGVLALLVLLTATAPIANAQSSEPELLRSTPTQTAEQNEEKTIYFFYGQGCPHCAKVEQWFQEENIYDSYPVEAKEVYFNDENRQLFTESMDRAGIPVNERGVPTLVAGDEIITGDDPIIENFYEVADAYLASDGSDAIPEQQESTTAEEGEDQGEYEDSVLSLWMVISASLVDSINPCAFAVLVILLTTVLAKKNRKKALMSGLAFTASIFISYILMGLGVYAALGSAGIASRITMIVGIVAIILGLWNLKNWLWYDKGNLIEVPQSWRPKMVGLIEKVTSPGGAFAIGFLVSLFLLPCTSGPYIIILGLLAENSFNMAAVGYLLLYNLIFVSPMLLITLLVYKGLDPEKVEQMRQENLERLHLVAGLILIAIGVAVVLTS